LEGSFLAHYEIIGSALTLNTFFCAKAEQSSVAQLQALLTRTIEAISFVLLLNDYKLGELIAK
jgi:hypothetical protein